MSSKCDYFEVGANIGYEHPPTEMAPHPSTASSSCGRTECPYQVWVRLCRHQAGGAIGKDDSCVDQLIGHEAVRPLQESMATAQHQSSYTDTFATSSHWICQCAGCGSTSPKWLA
jgi:hypothetical protein